ncbi:hypothetical protein [Leifsonia poae]|uniref:hypothetical protein n=1 Tax=Leifsonia poae TaxID=110933 RepID=UPI001CBBD9F8|nr:hypothetical protein [Leifsonia poae]
MSHTRWLVKIDRSGERIIAIRDSEDACRTLASSLNEKYQTDEYYAEQWDTGRGSWTTGHQNRSER